MTFLDCQDSGSDTDATFRESAQLGHSSVSPKDSFSRTLSQQAHYPSPGSSPSCASTSPLVSLKTGVLRRPSRTSSFSSHDSGKSVSWAVTLVTESISSVDWEKRRRKLKRWQKQTKTPIEVCQERLSRFSLALHPHSI